MAETEAILCDTLHKIAMKEGLENYIIETKSATTDGANYTSVIYKAVITSSNRKDLKLFAKVACTSQKVRDEVKFSDVIYELERHFYLDMVPKFEHLQDKYDFPNEERFKFPKLYGCNAVVMEETIVMEDLGAQGYILWDRLQPLDWEYASKAVEELAKFHALSFAYKNEYPERSSYFSKFDSEILQIFIGFKAIYNATAAIVIDLVPEDLKARLRTFADKQITDETFHKYYGGGKWEVLIHGDYRSSNIMHKNQNGVISSLVPVDYQTLHHGSPCIDLLYFIYSGTDEEFRRDHLRGLIDHYYGTFCRWLRQMNLDPDRVMSRKDFDEDYKDMLGYGLLTAMCTLPLVLVEAEQAPTLGKEGISDFSVQPTENFRQRFMPILREFINLGVL